MRHAYMFKILFVLIYLPHDVAFVSYPAVLPAGNTDVPPVRARQKNSELLTNAQKCPRTKCRSLD